MGPLFWLPTRGSGSRASASSQTCVDVVGQPQISLVDFNGQTGANYVTGGAGKYFVLYNQLGKVVLWFFTGTETAPSVSEDILIQIGISAVATASDISLAVANVFSVTPLSFYNTGVQVNGGGSLTAVSIASIQNANFLPPVDVNTGAAISQTQNGYPSGHICSPTSDALAGIMTVRFQATYLGVGMNSSVNGGVGGPAYTTKDLSGNPLLFQDAAMTIPAVNQGDTVMAWKDTVSGLSAISPTSGNAYTLQFVQDSIGMWTPHLSAGATSFFLVASNSALNMGDVFTIALTLLNTSSAAQQLLSKGTGAYGAAINTSGDFLVTEDLVAILYTSNQAFAQYTTAIWQKNGASNVLTFDGTDVTGSGTNATLGDTASSLSIGAQNGGFTFMGKLSSVFLNPAILSSGNLSALNTYAASLRP